MVRLRWMTSAALVAVLAVAGTAVWAQGPGGRRGGGPGVAGPGARPGGPGEAGFGVDGLALRGLNLSDAQRQQIRDVTMRYRDTTSPAAERLRQAMEAQQAAIRTEPLNEGEIRSTTQALADAQTEVAIQQAHLRADIVALLTPDQQQKAKDLQAQREARMKERRDRARARQAQQRGAV